MLKLTPRINENTSKVLEEKNLIRELENGFGSPLNIIIPENFGKNIEEFREIYEEHNLEGRVLYACKSNKSESILEEGREKGIMLDVSSKNELRKALRHGFKGKNIEATGPKNREFLELALAHDCLVNVDNLEELEYIAERDKETEVLLRFSGFEPKDRKVIQKQSRFGIDVDRSEEAMEIVKDSDIVFKGFAFHIDTSNMRKRTIAVENIFDLYHEYSESGLIADVINIGGGFRTNYLESHKEWSDYIEAIKEAVAGDREPVSWNNYDYGFEMKDGSVKGSLNAYEYYQDTTGPEYLDKLLQTEISSYDATFSELLKTHMIELYIEQGRALLDQVGLTIGNVNFTKKSKKDELMVGLDMNKTNMNSLEQEMFVDPVHIYEDEREELEDGAYFIGNLCLESDFIYRHKTFLDKKPEKGDLIVFVNTAAYNMDFYESETIEHDTAEKVAVYSDGDELKWTKDENYRSWKKGEKYYDN